MVNPYSMVAFLLWLFMAVINAEIAADKDECTEASCSRHGPTIRFPFRIKDKQSNHCGYPGFDLSCAQNKHTLLELPNLVKLYVRKIDYKSQMLHVYDPETCLPRSLVSLSLSTSSLQFGNQDILVNYSMFNCTSFYSTYYFFEVPCYRTSPGYHVYAFSGYSLGRSSFSSCTKMYDLHSVPLDIPYNNDLPLFWPKPNCTNCEAVNQKCKLKSNTTFETECYRKLEQRKGGNMKERIAASIGSIFLVVVLIAIYIVYRTNKADKENQAKIERFLEDYRALKPTRYSYADIKRVTDNFKDELGRGSYGTVFKGKLSNEVLVAVKILDNSTGNGEEFINEVGMMCQIHHVNVVRLVGYCADGFRRGLVYEFLSNESLDKFIFSANGRSNHFLGWVNLHKIGLGVAKGIEYLHQGCEQRILHFDIKPHNVLLDENFNAKISDFGLAKLCSKDQSAVSVSMARGTVGYIAPEVLSRNFGNVSYKSDVYSFGMLLLEMVGGRNNMDAKLEDSSRVNFFPEWIYSRLVQGEVVTSEIEEEGEDTIARKLAIVGMWCIQWNPVDRPSMKVALQMLEGDGKDLPMPPNPFASAANKRSGFSGAGRHLHQDLGVISETE